MKRWLLSTCVMFCMISTASFGARAAEKTAAEMLPASTAAYAEIGNTKQLLGLVLDNSIAKRIEELPDVKKAMDTKEYKEFLAVVALVETQIGSKWRPALEAVTEGGIYIAGDPETNGVAFLIKARDEAILTKVHDTLRDLTFKELERQGKGGEIETKDYRGITAYKAKDGAYAQVGTWFVLTNKGDLGKKIIDQYLDGGKTSLANEPEFQQARSLATGDKPAGWAYFKIKTLRDAGKAEKLSEGKTENPLAELIAGGVVSNLQNTPYITASLYADKSQLRLVAATPHDPKWLPENRSFYFGADGKGLASKPLKVAGTLLSISMHRDLGALWLASSDLFNDDVTAEIAKADSGLSQFFSGRNFGREVLGGFGPQVQVIVSRQTFDVPAETPSIKLPAMAFVFEMKDPAKMRTQLTVAFQSTVGLLNIVGAQQGQPQMEQKSEERGKASILYGKYLDEADEKQAGKGKINLNLTPAVAFAEKRFIISTSRQLASQLVDLAAKTGTDERLPSNVAVDLDVTIGKQLLSDNLEHLIAQNILQKGHTQEEAEKEIKLAMEALSYFKGLAIRLINDTKSLKLEFSVQTGE